MCSPPPTPTHPPCDLIMVGCTWICLWTVLWGVITRSLKGPLKPIFHQNTNKQNKTSSHWDGLRNFALLCLHYPQARAFRIKAIFHREKGNKQHEIYMPKASPNTSVTQRDHIPPACVGHITFLLFVSFSSDEVRSQSKCHLLSNIVMMHYFLSIRVYFNSKILFRNTFEICVYSTTSMRAARY